MRCRRRQKSKIVYYLDNTTGVPVLAKGVENLLAEIKKRWNGNLSDNGRVQDVLTSCCAVPGNIADTFTDGRATPRASRYRRLTCAEYQADFLRFCASMLPTGRI